MKKILCLLLITAAVILTACSEKQVQEPKIREVNTQKLLNDQSITQGNFEFIWQSSMPMKENEYLGKIFVSGDKIYGLTNSNYLSCYNRNTGRTVFNKPFGKPGLPVLGFTHYGNRVFSVVGDTLIEFDTNDGFDSRTFDLKYSIASMPARNEKYYYIPGVDDRLHCVKAQNGVHVFEVASKSQTPVTAVIAEENFVIYVSQAGDIQVMEPQRPKSLWSDKVADAINNPMAHDLQNIYFSCRDAHVYCFTKEQASAADGHFKWRYASGGLLKDGPVVTETTLYQLVEKGGIIALDKNSGKLRWQKKNAVKFLAEQDGIAYLASSDNKLLAVRNKDGNIVNETDITNITDYVSNTLDSRIYLAGKYGRIICIRPIVQK